MRNQRLPFQDDSVFPVLCKSSCFELCITNARQTPPTINNVAAPAPEAVKATEETTVLDPGDVARYEAALMERSPWTGKIVNPAERQNDTSVASETIFEEEPDDAVDMEEKLDSPVDLKEEQDDWVDLEEEPHDAMYFEDEIDHLVLQRNNIWATVEPRFLQLKRAAVPFLIVLSIAVGVCAYSMQTVENPKKNTFSDETARESMQVDIQPIVASLPPRQVKTAIQPIQIEKEYNVLSQESLAKYASLVEEAQKWGSRSKKEQILREAITVHSDGDEALARLSILLMDAKSTRSEALELAEHAAKINTQSGIAWLAIGYINQLNGNIARSTEGYRMCSESEGPTKYVNECRGLLPKVHTLY